MSLSLSCSHALLLLHVCLLTTVFGAPTSRAQDITKASIHNRGDPFSVPLASPQRLPGSNTLYPQPRWSSQHDRPTPTAAGTLSITTSASAFMKSTATQSYTRATPSSTPLAASSGKLQLSLINSLSSDRAHAYITGLDSNGRVVMLATNGDFYYPSASGSTPQKITANVAIPLQGGNHTTQIVLPDYISSGRAWFADGTLTFSAVAVQGGTGLVEPTAVNPNDPNINVNWGFVEFTNNAENGIYVNLSFVDFIGLPLGIQLQTTAGGTQSAYGTTSDAVAQICSNLKAQTSVDGQPWNELCVYNKRNSLIRVVSPTTLLAQAQPHAFDNYWSTYIDRVWEHYSSRSLTINTQSAVGKVKCKASGNEINCAGDNRTYPKPTAADIFGCSTGTFSVLQSDNSVHRAVVPRLCAAFHRATFLVAGGHVQPGLPPTKYYSSAPNNFYSALVHQAEVDGNGYAFPYDDVTPSSNFDTAGVLSAPDPQLLTVFVGGKSGA